jgi:hypothetical protein
MKSCLPFWCSNTTFSFELTLLGRGGSNELSMSSVGVEIFISKGER